MYEQGFIITFTNIKTQHLLETSYNIVCRILPHYLMLQLNYQLNLQVCVNGTTSQGFPNIIGREANSLIGGERSLVFGQHNKRADTCFECCATDACNDQLCSHLQRKLIFTCLMFYTVSLLQCVYFLRIVNKPIEPLILSATCMQCPIIRKKVMCPF